MTAPKRGTKGKQRAALSSTSKSAAGNGECSRQDCKLTSEWNEKRASALSEVATALDIPIGASLCATAPIYAKQRMHELKNSRAELAAKEASLNAALAQALECAGELGAAELQFDRREIELGAHLTRLISEHVALRREIEGLKAERDRARKDAGDWAINHENAQRETDSLGSKLFAARVICVTLFLMALSASYISWRLGHVEADRWYAAHPRDFIELRNEYWRDYCTHEFGPAWSPGDFEFECKKPLEDAR